MRKIRQLYTRVSTLHTIFVKDTFYTSILVFSFYTVWNCIILITVFIGVRFRTIGSHLNLEVQFTGYDFENGRLYTNLSYWKGNDNTDVTPGTAR